MLQAVVQFLRAHNPTGLECDRVCCGIDLLTGLHMNAIARSIRRVASILVICLPLGFSAPVLHADESIKTDMRHAAHAIGDAAHEVGEDAKHALKEVVPTARKIGHTVARSAKEAGRAVAQGARETGTELKEAAHKGTKAAKREK